MFLEGNKFVKLANLVKLLTEGDEKTIKRLAEKMGISDREIYRAIHALEDFDFEVRKTTHSKYKITGMPFPGDVDEQDVLNLSDQEMSLMNFIIRGQCFSVPGTEKVVKEYMNGVGHDFSMQTLRNVKDMENERGYLGILKLLVIAMESKKTVHITDYKCGRENEIKEYVVEPYHIFDNLKSVLVFCPKKKRSFTLKISRMGCVKIRDDPWIFEELHDMDIGDIFGMHGKAEYQVHLKLTNMSEDILLEEYPRSRRYIVKIRDDPHLIATVHDLRAVGRFVLGLMDQIEVVGGPELKKYLSDFLMKHGDKLLHYR